MMNIKESELYDRLIGAVEKLPPEAIEKAPKEITRKGYDTTGYQYQYLVNICNEILGLTGWGFDYEIVKDIEGTWGEKQKRFFEVSINLTMWMKVGDTKAERKCAGGHKADLHGDALKGAITNALKKTMAMFGVGKKAYEGTIDEDYTAIPSGNGKIKQREIQPTQPAQSPQPPKTTGKGISEKQKDKLSQIRNSHLITENEGIEIGKIIWEGNGIKASEKIKDWFGEDWKGGERQRREYIELYVKSATQGMGEPQKELLSNLENEAKAKIKDLELDKIAVLIKELKDE